jgi:hypothetical protein
MIVCHIYSSDNNRLRTATEFIDHNLTANTNLHILSTELDKGEFLRSIQEKLPAHKILNLADRLRIHSSKIPQIEDKIAQLKDDNTQHTLIQLSHDQISSHILQLLIEHCNAFVYLTDLLINPFVTTDQNSCREFLDVKTLPKILINRTNSDQLELFNSDHRLDLSRIRDVSYDPVVIYRDNRILFITKTAEECIDQHFELDLNQQHRNRNKLEAFNQWLSSLKSFDTPKHPLSIQAEILCRKKPWIYRLTLLPSNDLSKKPVSSRQLVF